MGKITIVIHGKPIAKKRPRFARRGKYVATINDQETEEGKFFLEARHKYDGNPLQGALSLSVSFRMPRPKAHYGTGKNSSKLKLSAPRHHTKKPDLDNLVKFVKDCLNNLAWEDDCQVVRLEAEKVYDDTPKTIIQIEPVCEDCHKNEHKGE